jgi:hypothetical protein
MTDYNEKKRQRYSQDAEYRERTLAAKRRRYAEDPQYREAAKARSGRSHQRKKAGAALLFDLAVPKKKSMSASEWSLWRNYGLTQTDYDFMVAAQRGLCAICERRPRTKLCVDHCHTTRRLRFLLCNKCNTGFGQFEEDPRLLRRAADYAEFWQRLQAADIAVRLVPEAKPRKRRKKAAGALSHCPKPYCAGRGTAAKPASSPRHKLSARDNPS